MSGPLKDSQIKINVDDALKRDAERIANVYGTTPSALARTLLSQYANAHREHKGHIPWPPQFQYYDADPVTDPREPHQEGNGKKQERRARPVAVEEGSRYATKRTKVGYSKEV